MNSTKELLCNIVIDLKEDERLTYDTLVAKFKTHNKSITKKQLVQIIKHKGKGVSIEVIDHLIYKLGWDIDVMIKPHNNRFIDMEITHPEYIGLLSDD